MKKTVAIGNWKLEIKEEWRLAFITTWIVGLLAHAYRFFNFLPIWDSMYNFTGVGSTYSLGRWFLPYVGLMSSIFDLPWVNGALSLLYISISIILMIELFQIKEKILIVLCSAVFVSFPTVVSTFAYMFTADAYMLAFLLSVMSIYLTKRFEKWGMLAGMVSLAFAMGIYQAYATVAIVLVLLYIILQFIFEKLSFLEAVKKDLKYLGTLLGGAVLYFIILKICLWHFDTSLQGYQGIGQMGIMSFAEYKAAMIKTKFHMLQLLGLENGVIGRPYALLNAAILLVITALVVYWLVKNKVYEKKLSFLAAIAALILIPVGAYAIYFTSPTVEYYTLMEMAVCMIYLLLIMLLTRIEWKTWTAKALKTCGIVALCGLIYHNVINCNTAYWNLNLSYHKSMSIAEDVLERVEQMDEFTDTNQVITLIGDYNCPTDGLRIMYPNIMGISNDSFLNDSYHYTNLWNCCFGVQMQQAPYEEMMAVMDTEEFQNMPVYPCKGCVAYINGIFVVRMS